jgi:hypothetical protein
MFVAPDPNIKIYTPFDMNISQMNILPLKNQLRIIKIEKIFKIKKPNL